jgi:hypothetical protein
MHSQMHITVVTGGYRIPLTYGPTGGYRKGVSVIGQRLLPTPNTKSITTQLLYPTHKHSNGPTGRYR